MDMGTLRFARNGRDLGMAVQGLEGTLYPAFSLYNRCDIDSSFSRTSYMILGAQLRIRT